MSQEQAKQYILQGINAARAKQQDQARQLFQNAIRLDPQNETAWAWMSTVAKDNRERLFCFQELLKINPNNEVAHKGLKQLGVDPATMQPKPVAPAGAKAGPASSVPASAAAPGIPVIPPERLNAVMPTLDEFIRNYKPAPVALDDAAWTQKTSGLYGIAAARRRQARIYGALGAVVLLIGAVLIFALMTLLSGEEAAEEANVVTFRFTNTPTPTATSTPGVTNTPSPEPANPLPTFAPPENLVQGDIYGGTPTPFYPEVSSGAGRDFQLAVNQYSIGEYEPAFEVFAERQAEAEGSNLSCNAQAYYYHIVGLAEIGGRQNLQDAQALVQRAVARPKCVEDNESVILINTAACFADYVQGMETGDISQFTQTASLCQDAITRSAPRAPVVLAITTLARIYLAQQNYDAAAAVLDDGLAAGNWPNDVNLMLTRAEVELARGRLEVALNFISRALYVEPTSEPALRLRVEAFLRTAEAEEDRQQQIQLYGTAVIWTQEYLLFHPGKPSGYLLMAKARIGEGNLDLAEEALNRVIEARRELPEQEQSVVLEALQLRAEIYYDTARYEPAFTDVEFLLGQTTDDPNPRLLQRRLDLAYFLENYAQVLEDIETLLEQGTATSPNTLRLLRVKILTEICLTHDSIDCDYDLAAQQLSDDFINDLSDSQQLIALSYRAKVIYHQTLANDDLSNNERTRNLEDALTDINAALANDENGLDLYYKGLILEALDETDAALKNYQYVVYWSQFYDYPFTEDVQARIEALQEG